MDSHLVYPAAVPKSGKPAAKRRLGPTTEWLTIRSAAAENSSERRRAFDALYRSYHPHIVRFIVCQGVPPDLAADIAQKFFVRLFVGKDLEKLDPERGSFRSWLRTAARHFFLNFIKSNKALCNGGGAPHLELERAACVADESSHQRQLDALFDECRRELVVLHAYRRLRRDHPLPWDSAIVTDLYRELTGEARKGSQEGRLATDAQLAEQLGCSELAVRQRRFRLRTKFRQHLERERVIWAADDKVLPHVLEWLGREPTTD
ncbi:MAG TPA: sigma-70 family RNA polymerase sigma factor [Polyangiaceae bacterium]|nr:sigma-70 family RNA polymerase sigma factor [Polyangiaceae bacterium]